MYMPGVRGVTRCMLSGVQGVTRCTLPGVQGVTRCTCQVYEVLLGVRCLVYKVLLGVHARWYGRRAFAVAAPATWNTLSDELRNPDLHSATFRRNLKTFLFQQYLAH